MVDGRLVFVGGRRTGGGACCRIEVVDEFTEENSDKRKGYTRPDRADGADNEQRYIGFARVGVG